MKKRKTKVINGELYKAIGYTYDGKVSGWIKCDIELKKKQ